MCVAAEEGRWEGERKRDHGTRDSHTKTTYFQTMLLCEAVKKWKLVSVRFGSGPTLLAET